ncbi:MAG: stage V sporulation protein AB [Aristaeellaceae bacterium]
MNEWLAVLIGLMTGSAMSVAVSCAWVVLQVPARVQDRLQLASSRSLTWAMYIGLLFTALNNALGFELPLPRWCGSLGMLLGGMFVGMLASALVEILEVAPVLMRRFRVGNVSTGVRFTMMVGKALGAILAALVFTL